MGHLHFFNLKSIIEQYQARAFIETGTGLGFGVYFASLFPFELIVSIEIVEDELTRLRRHFGSDARVKLLAGKSVEVMKQILPQINVPIVYWLDAHYPGADLMRANWDAEKDADVRLPLEQELQLIKDLRPGNRDVILIDDLRIYERGNWGWGELPHPELFQVRHDSRFLYSIFAETHNPQRFFEHSGYFALLPK